MSEGIEDDIVLAFRVMAVLQRFLKTMVAKGKIMNTS
jgi:hypothetical protein